MTDTVFSIYNQKIESVIKRLQGDAYLIKAIKENKCSCLKLENSDPNPDCPYCLGTGYRIKIYKIKAVIQDTQLVSTVRSTTESITAQCCYTLAKYPLCIDDLIVCNGEVYLVNEVKECRSQENKIIYRISFCVKKKYYTNLFMKNFNRIIGG